MADAYVFEPIAEPYVIEPGSSSGRIACSVFILRLDIRPARRPLEPHACELPAPQHCRRFPRPLLRPLRTHCLPRSTRRRFPNLPLHVGTSPACLLLVLRNANRRLSVSSLAYPQARFSSESALRRRF